MATCGPKIKRAPRRCRAAGPNVDRRRAGLGAWRADGPSKRAVGLHRGKSVFSPHGGCTDAIVEAIRNARKQILVQAYEMTSAPIKSALVAAHRRGVEVTAIFDPDALKERDTMVGELASAGIPIFVDSAHIPGLAHNKVMVIDQVVVITGSFNFTRAAESRNAENLLIIDSLAVAAQYAHNFATHLAHSSPLGAASISPPKPYRHYHRRHYYEHSYW